LFGARPRDGDGVTDAECPQEVGRRLDDEDSFLRRELHEAPLGVDFEHLPDDPVLIAL
jgi:hypothetical protein